MSLFSSTFSLNSWPVYGRSALDLFESDPDLVYDEKTRAYRAELNVAGYKREDITVEALDGAVTITAENARWGKAARTFYVDDIDADRIEAKLEDGVIALTFPLTESSKPRKIAVN